MSEGQSIETEYRFVAGAAAALAACAVLNLAACGKAPGGSTSTASARASAGAARAADNSRGRHSSAPLLTKEEVGAVLGHPVTAVEGATTDMDYKTAIVGLEVSIGLEEEHDGEATMSSARKATGMLGGAPEDVPHLGDEAFFGAMSVLYVRHGDTVITITPPNLQLVAGMAAYNKVTDAKLGSAEQAKAMQELVQVEKTDPTAAGLNSSDDMQGALAVVAASSKKQGTSYETEARAIVVALAAKVLSKL